MVNSYIAYNFKIKPTQTGSEILIAELGHAGFESFVETENGITAYIQKQDWNAAILEDIHILESDEFEISYDHNEIVQTNWNGEWEKNFKPISVDGEVTVRAPFHNKPSTTYDLIIEPKMSFGTGHHETTHMMIQHMLKNEFKEKSVLDMGCGTGVLAILAEKLGAENIDAIDIDHWCFLNSLENSECNECSNISVYKGDVSLIKGKQYDCIIANINRNILLRDIPLYATCLKDNGSLFLSGFYKDDLEMISKMCLENNLVFQDKIIRNHWVAAKFVMD